MRPTRELRCDPRRIPQEHRVEMLADLRRRRAILDHQEALLLEAMAVDPQPYPGDPIANDKNYVQDEVAACLHLAPTTAAARLDSAATLVARFPDALELMEEGLLPAYYAARLVLLTDGLSDAHAAKVAKRVLPRAPGQTISQFTAAINRAVLAVDPATAEEEHARSRADRRVVFNPPSTNSMVEMYALLTAEQAAELQARVDAQARAWRGLDPTDPRTMDQLRADALCALGSDLVPVTAQVHVSVALSTLLGVDDQPGDVNGEPVAAAVARALAFDPGSRWRRLLHDDGRRLIDVSSDTYEPPEALRWNSLATAPRNAMTERDNNSEGRRGGSDHTIPWSQGGPTTPRNLVCLCTRHHHLKHDTRWTYTRDPDTGVVTWTSPHGKTYKRPPPETPG